MEQFKQESFSFKIVAIIGVIGSRVSVSSVPSTKYYPYVIIILSLKTIFFKVQ